MNVFSQTLLWLGDASNWEGTGGISVRLVQHMQYSLATLAITCVIAIPLACYIGHFGRALFVIPVINALRALPTLGMLSALALIFGLGISAPMIVMVMFAIPPVLAATYSGIANVSQTTTHAMRAIGFSEWQILWNVELPTAFPAILGGIRSAFTQIIATWTVAAFLPVGGLGRFLIDGLAIRDYSQMLGASFLVIGLSIAVDVLMLIVQNTIERHSRYSQLTTQS
ncbi:MAG: ABC transporter permease [Bifidobacterium aquikefiri]|uniref:Glycine/betaine ABC transporter permease n=1 Tax=Bifidobacterium aquikefiri TaxID=1653207 RepID=A0A261GA73_9BIFI|nr:ABC transporter permease [Bifidobacterium aquikefiri]OZG67876.1 glycine/betaine ABC transporter permease [Bifidobacterium aquikefiri]